MRPIALPQKHGKAREQALINAVLDDNCDLHWSEVTSEEGGHRGVFRIFSDALVVSVLNGDTPQNVRVNVTAETSQHIADILGACLPTAKLLDLAWLQRKATLTPCTRKITSSTKAMIETSQRVDAQLQALGNPQGLLSTVGKHWILDTAILKKKNRAVNYGWHFEGSSFHDIKGEVAASAYKDPNTGQYGRLIQGRGSAHDIHHVDYSQICRLVARDCEIDGEVRDLADVLKDPELSVLVSHQGPLSFHRHPYVEEKYVGMTIFGSP
jgi:hypothetical protein